MGKRTVHKKNDVLSASEIGQYQYCSCAWWLQRCGYEPEATNLESGKHVHATLGNKIDGFEVKLQHSRWYTILASVVLCIALILVFFGVIL